MPPIGEEHIVKSFDADLRALHDALVKMGAQAEQQLADALTALENRDGHLATLVMQNDALVDAAEEFVNEQTVRVLVLRAPVADDLRTVLTSSRLAGNLERVADLAANIAKRSLVLNQQPAVGPIRSLVRLGRMVQELLQAALNALLSIDAQAALAVRDRDQDVDDQYSSLFREILTYMMEDPRTITACSHLLFVAKNLERIGDHATNMAEVTHFLATGRPLKEKRPKRDTTILEG